MTVRYPTRRAALAGLALLAPTPVLAQGLSAQDKALVDQAVNYLQSLSKAKGRFTQTDARGRITRGDFFMQRPGKARFAYDAPTNLLVVSDGRTVNVEDKRLKTFESYPLSSTPLSLFLAREIRLDRGVQVSQVRRLPGGFSITAKDARKETQGSITMVFGQDPMSLREWTVVDPRGQTTRVVLSGLAPVASLDPALFVSRNPRDRAGGARPR